MPLALKRKKGQEILLTTSDGLVKIHVVKAQGSYAHLSIDAPKSVTVVRKELTEPSSEDTSKS